MSKKILPKDDELFPLSVGQETMLGCLTYCIKKTVINISVVLRFNSEIDEELLKKACGISLFRNECCRVRIHKVGKKNMQYICSEPLSDVDVLDYTNKTEEELEADLKKKSRFVFPNKGYDTELCYVHLIRQPKTGIPALHFQVSHLAFDAFALSAIVSDILKVYKALRDKTEIPPYLGDYRKMCNEEMKKIESGLFQRNEDYWIKEAFAAEPLLAPVDKKMKLTKGKRSGKSTNLFRPSSYHKNRTITKELFERIEAKAAEANYPPQLYYLIALRSYFSKINNDQEDITIMNILSRRANLLEKRSGGTRANGIPLRMNFPSDMKVCDALKKLKKIQHEAYKHYEVLIAMMFIKLLKRFNNPMMNSYYPGSFTYFPYFTDVPDDIDCTLKQYPVGASSQGFYLTVMALDKSGNRNCNYDCLKVYTSDDTVDNMHNHLVAALEAILDNPDMTLSELNRV